MMKLNSFTTPTISANCLYTGICNTPLLPYFPISAVSGRAGNHTSGNPEVAYNANVTTGIHQKTDSYPLMDF
jgi:hypothetical protein